MAVPKLRFKEFDGDWTLSELDDHIHESKASSKIQDEYEVLTSSRRGLIRQADYFENSRLTDRENIGFNIIEPDQITYRSRSDDGFFFFNLNGLGITGIISTYYPVFTMKKGNNWFLNELLNYHKYKYIQYAVGTSQLVLSLNQLRKIKFNIPCLDEQTKIASFFSAVDEKISQLTQKYELLSQYKQGMMQKLFSQQIRFKADDGSEFGEWEETVFERIGAFLKGKGISKADIVADGEIPCIRYGELYTHYGEIISEVISSTNIDRESLILSKANDVLIPASGETQIDIATASCVLLDDIALSGDLNIFRTKENGIFLSYLIRSKLKMQIAQLAQGNSVVHLYSSQLKGVQLSLPCLEEQTKIANFLSAIDQKIEVVTQQIEQAKQWKKGLLQQMFV